MLTCVRGLRINHKVQEITWKEYRLEAEGLAVALYDKRLANISDDPLYPEWIIEEKISEVWKLNDAYTPEYIRLMFTK